MCVSVSDSREPLEMYVVCEKTEMHMDRQKDSENERASVTVENINKRIQKNVDAESTYVRT